MVCSPLIVATENGSGKPVDWRQSSDVMRVGCSEGRTEYISLAETIGRNDCRKLLETIAGPRDRSRGAGILVTRILGLLERQRSASRPSGEGSTSVRHQRAYPCHADDGSTARMSFDGSRNSPGKPSIHARRHRLAGGSSDQQSGGSYRHAFGRRGIIGATDASCESSSAETFGDLGRRGGQSPGSRASIVGRGRASRRSRGDADGRSWSRAAASRFTQRLFSLSAGGWAVTC